jgi:hypothetical protein
MGTHTGGLTGPRGPGLRAATVTTGSGGRRAAQEARDPVFQDQLTGKLAAFTGISLLAWHQGS